MTDFPTGYVVAAGAGGTEDYFREINAASGDDERTRIDERHGIRILLG